MINEHDLVVAINGYVHRNNTAKHRPMSFNDFIQIVRIVNSKELRRSTREDNFMEQIGRELTDPNQ